jgi:hypothetical protein
MVSSCKGGAASSFSNVVSPADARAVDMVAPGEFNGSLFEGNLDFIFQLTDAIELLGDVRVVGPDPAKQLSTCPARVVCA